MVFKDPEKFALFMKIWTNMVPILLLIIGLYDLYLVIFKHNWISLAYALLIFAFFFMWVFRNKMASLMTSQEGQVDDSKIDEIEKKLERMENKEETKYIG